MLAAASGFSFHLMNSCNFSCVYPTFEQFSGHGRLLSQSEWRQALEEEEEQKVRVGGGS